GWARRRRGVVASAVPGALPAGAPSPARLPPGAGARRARGGGRRRRARLAFLAGLGVILIALTGRLDAAVETSFSWHMTQHLLLTMVAAPLLLLGAPLTLALQAWPGRPRRTLLDVLHSDLARVIANPIVAWALFF